MQVGESLAQLLDITKAFEESYNEAGTGRSSEAEFAPVLAAAVDPLVEMCERSADSLQPDAPSRCTQHLPCTCFHLTSKLNILISCYVWAITSAELCIPRMVLTMCARHPCIVFLV